MQNEHNLFHSIHQLSRLLTKEANKALQHYGLYSAQWSVIYTLKVQGYLTQKQLCDYLSVEAPPMTRTIQRLMKQGYVKQNPSLDRRSKNIELTEKALTEYPIWEKVILDVHENLLKNVEKSSQKQLHSLISSWLVELHQREDD